MSPPENNLTDNNNLNCILLCAGEGRRISSHIVNIPKSLIPLSIINEEPILLDTLKKLISLNPKRILIIIGYLKEQIEEFVSNLMKTNPKLTSNIILVDSKFEYKKGPLYSFLSLIKLDQILEESSTYLLLPGDTIFESNLLSEISKHKNVFTDEPNIICALFFREITLSAIRDRYKEYDHKSRFLISIAKIQKKNKSIFLKRIITKNISNISPNKKILQIIPCYLFKYYFLQEVKLLPIKRKLNTLTEATNLLIKRGKKISLYRINSEFNFYDIDTYQDLASLNKKVDNSSSDNLRIYEPKT